MKGLIYQHELKRILSIKKCPRKLKKRWKKAILSNISNISGLKLWWSKYKGWTAIKVR